MKLKKIALVLLVASQCWVFGFAETKTAIPLVNTSLDANIVLIEDQIDATGTALVVKEHRIIKLLTPAGIQRYSALQFTYTEPREKVEILNVQITTPDGKTTPISLADEKLTTPLEKYPPFAGLKAVALDLKNLQPGATLDYTFSMTTQPWIADQYWQEIFPQDVDSIQKERVILIEKQNRQAAVKMYHGTLPKPILSDTATAAIREWDFENLPPFATEPSMPPAPDVAPHIVISTVQNWQQIAQSFQKEFLIPTGDPGLEKTLTGIVKKGQTPQAQLNAIYGFVAQSIRSLPPNLGGEIEKIPHPLDYTTLMNLGLGDCRDKASLLADLLKKAGFNAELALLSTASNGVVFPDTPAPFAFNRLVVKVNDGSKTMWLDPYSESAPVGYLPPDLQGRQALLLNTSQFVQTPIFSASSNRRDINVQAKLSKDGSLKEVLELNADGADGFALRSILRNLSDQDKQRAVASIVTQIIRPAKIDAISLSSVDNLSAPMAVGIKFQTKNYATIIGDLAFLPIPINILNTFLPVLAVNEPRRYPFVVGNLLEEKKHLELSLPAGYKIRTLPKGQKIQNDVGAYQASFSTTGTKLIFNSFFTVNQISVSPDEFSKLKSLVSAKVDVEESKVVLRKVGQKDIPSEN